MKEELHSNLDSVMIIDDNLIDLYIVSRLLTKNNFGKKVLQYSSALDALTYLHENQENIAQLPNLIFVDIYMPGMSGFEFMVEYDKLPSILKSHCRVYIFSSSIDKRDINKAKNDMNVIAMEQKPITKEFLNKLKLNFLNPIT